MNLPNKLTLIRVILIPFFVFFLLINPESTALRIIADIIFIGASLTDMADGKIARKYGISIQRLKQLNNIKGNLIRPGQVLRCS